ncbi:MAG TPA: ABC transporter ATP-binding protein [Spirochaetia bacterium]|nr:ABC transporter ATP-binding protein [Spirochaetia bacterium]
MHKEPKGVRLLNITKIYRDPKTKKDFPAVDNISLDIEPGSFVTILGPSGCGKTTTLRIIAGFESPDTGEIYIGDEAVNALTPNKRDTAMVFQSYALLPHYNVFDNVAYGLRIRKLPKDDIRASVMAMLDMVKLNGMEERMTNQLSGGQQQRVALARALVMQPGVLLFDEPLSNLDAKLRVNMRNEIRNIQRTLGLTAIYVTHDQAEAMSLSDQIVIMENGKIAQIGSPRDIYYRPNSEFIADFIGEANFLKVIIEGEQNGRLKASFDGIPLEMESPGNVEQGSERKIVIRPESIRLQDTGRIPCKVIVSTFMGSYQYYQVMTDDTMVIITDYNPRSRKIYQAGERAWMMFDDSALHIL